MIAELKPYPAMKGSGLPWLEEVPDHWRVQRLRHVAELRVSNVDKHTREGEQPVRLCNYTDVYKHDRIIQSMPFTRATASADEIERFRLEAGDVLITKDSEAWDDIGVPALVELPADDLISGYHLALLRPHASKLSGSYLFRAFQTRAVAHQLYVVASGVTRYGLSHAAIKSVWMAVPPLPEQAGIVRFLDYVDLRVDRYIRAKQRLMKLMAEQRQTVTQHSVSLGLDPGVPMKPSGVEWLGDVPQHWEMCRAKTLFREVDQRSASGDEDLLSVSHLTGVTLRSEKNVTMFMASSNIGHKLCEPGDLVINTMWAWMGALGVASQRGMVSPAYGVYRPLPQSPLMPEYADLLLTTKPYIAAFHARSTGIQASRLRLYPDEFLRMPILCPPLVEQRAIVSAAKTDTSLATQSIRRTQREIALIREYRTRLIASVVIGKLDVREVAARLPNEDEESDLLETISPPAEIEEESGPNTVSEEVTA